MAKKAEGCERGVGTLDPARFRHPQKTTYILGAGFSYAAGVPLMNDFAPKALALLKDSRDELANALADLLVKYAPVAQAVNINLNNLEDLFCLVDLPSSGRSSDDRATLIEVIIRTLALAQIQHQEGLCSREATQKCQVLPRRYLHADLPPGVKDHCCPRDNFGVWIYEAFVSHILASQKSDANSERELPDLDCIITLNYDLVIEQALSAFDGAVCYYGGDVVKLRSDNEGLTTMPISRDESKKKCLKLLVNAETYKNTNRHRSAILQILKLHGSINWSCRNQRFAGVNRIWAPLLLDPTPKRGRVPLVPPTWRKDAPDTTVFASMTHEVIDHLRRAGKIVIIGYSMPDADRYFRYLLAKGLNTPEFPPIEVWDVKPRDEMRKRLGDIFGLANVEPNGKVVYKEGGFEKFVQSHPSDSR